MFSQYVGSCVFPRPNVSGLYVPGEEKRGKLRNRKKRFPAVKNSLCDENEGLLAVRTVIDQIEPGCCSVGQVVNAGFCDRFRDLVLVAFLTAPRTSLTICGRLGERRRVGGGHEARGRSGAAEYNGPQRLIAHFNSCFQSRVKHN
ncbi:hypothetical protein PRIPAC_85075 [Pristionchus pacificus]|uniref:Uncharacterized protein n=1 Tax=Pristionchus pacificus TaxID=54126 RepID=A0A2A6CCU4_PRIPA|nr:hypothetical protein PRIPAC_85075 [Pristionchus pacificus]|eukprot:PDM75863.1 hypothetical protein PRIPAC_40242 [Pristionchus pacificus]